MGALSWDVMFQSLGQVGLTVLAIVLFTAILELLLYLVFVKTLNHKYALPIMLLSPAAIGLLLLVVYPIGYELSLSASNMSLDNFKRSYNMTDDALVKLEEAGVPAELLGQLKGFTDQEYGSEEALMQGVQKTIGAEQAAQYRAVFLKSAQKIERLTITQETLRRLKEQQVPEDAVTQLEALLNHSFDTERALTADLKKTIGQDAAAAHKSAILAAADTTPIFKMTRRSMLSLKKGVPAELVTQLQEQQGVLNTTYYAEDDLLADIQAATGSDQIGIYRTAFLTHALANPGPVFGIRQAVKNFSSIFTQPVLKQVYFFPVLWRTIIWTAIQVPAHVIFGLGLALLLNRPMKMRGLYRTLIIVPWAIPQVIAVLAWRGEFHSQYGFFNIILHALSLPGVEWKTNPFWNFVAINITNIWLGVPFMMVILLGGLQSIGSTFYEAADVDGASRWEKFRHITLPLIQPVMTPAIVLGVIWTFNNFNVPYLLNDYELESSDILVTALFRAAFEYNRYGFAAAFAVVIFMILLVFCLVYMRVVKLDLGLAGGKKKNV